MKTERDKTERVSSARPFAGVRFPPGPGCVAAQRRSARRLAPTVRRAAVPLAALAVLLQLVGCGASNSARSPATVTVTVTDTVARTVERPSRAIERSSNATRPRRPPPIAQAASFKTLTGAYFSVDYSGSWYVEAAEADKGSYLDTTIRNAANPQVMLRVDVAPGGAKGDVVSSARQLELLLSRQPAYRRVDFRRTTFQGYAALRWEFEVSERGTLLRKVDIFFDTRAGDGVAILTQAPASTYTLWRRLFEQARSSLHVTDTGVGTDTFSTTPGGGSTGTDTAPAITEVAFCDSHPCITNFDNGTGTIVQCTDGMWSHSGGRPGACSYHGGVSGGQANNDGTSVPGSSNGYTQDYGSGNGYTVVCADGTVSDSGGIQGACSHHGGVGG